MQLLMFEEPGCVWCARWNEDVGGEYPITPEGQLAPLTRLQTPRPTSRKCQPASRPRYTPTFVVLQDGTEIGRIEGYPGRISSGASWVAFFNKKRPMAEQRSAIA
jgi:hypothetical protein